MNNPEFPDLDFTREELKEVARGRVEGAFSAQQIFEELGGANSDAHKAFEAIKSLPRKNSYTQEEKINILLEVTSLLEGLNVLPSMLWAGLYMSKDPLWQVLCPYSSQNHPHFIRDIELYVVGFYELMMAINEKFGKDK